ncbi:uncharacterized protein LOC106645060 [Copidosoma floridanum]|uniref:uncharacterized protein LOC106645060 n=1 Tax=Copidosoma floridanum TaxID=29053 RepID=UPI0006C956B7|nr:uncharacterized protein LOC106645060 [Copidosoma floridanum]
MRVEMDLNVPARFDPKKNQVAKDWKVWKKQFLTYLRLSSGYTTLSEEKKAYLLLNLMGPKAVEAMENMTFENPNDREDMNILLSKFDEVFDPLPNEIEKRYKFFSRRIERNETIDNYVKDLQKLANKCNFGNQKEKFIIDMLIRTMDKHLRQMTFNKEGICLEDIIESIKQDTVNNMRMKKLSENMTKDFKLYKKKDANIEKNASDEVKLCPRCNVRHQPGPCQVKDNSNEQTKRICIKCGTNHPYKQCPAFHNTCCKCHEKGHSAAQCEILKTTRNKKRLLNEQSHARSSSHNRKGISHSSLAPSEQMSRPTHLSHGYSNATPAPSNDAPPSYFQSEAESRNRLYPSLVDPQNDHRVYHQASYCQSCKNNPLATCFVCKRSSTNVGRANVLGEESFVKVEHTYISQYRSPAPAPAQTSQIKNQPYLPSYGSYNNTKKKNDACCIS